jgi:hypothetical protein
LLWFQHLSDTVSPDFTSRYNLPTPLEVYQFINLALQNPVPDAEWRYFLESCPWYMEQREFLLNAYKLFRGTGRLGVANYGMLQVVVDHAVVAHQRDLHLSCIEFTRIGYSFVSQHVVTSNLNVRRRQTL